MHALLERIGIARSEVVALGRPRRTAARRWSRKRCARPPPPSAGSKHGNADFARATEQALAGFAMIEAANAEEEALAIAVALREALETPGKTAALVTPDRALARRVVAALARWQVAVDDSGGDALADTAPACSRGSPRKPRSAACSR